MKYKFESNCLCNTCRYDGFTAIHCIKCLQLAKKAKIQIIRADHVKEIELSNHNFDTVTINKDNNCKYYKKASLGQRFLKLLGIDLIRT
jgi:hypothetical protein